MRNFYISNMLVTTFKDIKLQVGTRLQMAVQHGAQPLIYYTELLGYADGEYLIVRTPVENGLIVQIPLEERLTLRVFSGKNVITFNCTVKAVFRRPHFYMHLSFPKNINAQALRNVIRVKVDLPAQINGVPKAGVITDISVAGAGIVADRELGKLEEKISISFMFFIKPTNQHSQIEVTPTIRNIKQLQVKIKHASSKFLHGVLFHEIDSMNHVMLQNLVYESLHG